MVILKIKSPSSAKRHVGDCGQPPSIGYFPTTAAATAVQNERKNVVKPKRPGRKKIREIKKKLLLNLE